jgi:hypothetical protein
VKPQIRSCDAVSGTTGAQEEFGELGPALAWRDDLREMAARSTAFGPCRQGKELLVPRLHP